MTKMPYLMPGERFCRECLTISTAEKPCKCPEFSDIPRESALSSAEPDSGKKKQKKRAVQLSLA